MTFKANQINNYFSRKGTYKRGLWAPLDIHNLPALNACFRVRDLSHIGEAQGGRQKAPHTLCSMSWAILRQPTV